jgi:histidinol-phosphate aminotransferase
MKTKIEIPALVRPNIRSLRAYNAREIPCRVKLDANESPFPLSGWSARTRAGLLDAVSTNRYPDPEAKELRKRVARWLGVRPATILQGNGSDELIYYLITTFGGPVLYPVPTFSMYGIIARALGEEAIGVPLDSDFDIDIEKMMKIVRRKRPKLIFLSSPNNPTGNCFSADRILRLIEGSRGIVVVDEAYQPFAGMKGFLPLLKDYRNLTVMRTLSKIGLAALRLGFLIADPEIIGEVNKVRLPFNVNALSQKLAVSALKNTSMLKAAIRTIVSERERLMGEMGATKGVSPYPSEANFILFKVKDPNRLYRSLLKKGILVRNMNDAVGGCLRVTVGTPAENTAFLKALKSSLQ